MNFATLKGLTIPEGVVTQITDASGRVLWALKSGGKVILEVEKITSDTYAGETTYTAEEFILLDIYPETNGTVKVTYGGITKTVKDTGSTDLAGNPNAQQVYFGTFNGVSDEVPTPESGTLTIEGRFRQFGVGSFKINGESKNSSKYCGCVTAIADWGGVTAIPAHSFDGCTGLTSITFPDGLQSIGDFAFANFHKSQGSKQFDTIVFPEGLLSIGARAFYTDAIFYPYVSGIGSIILPSTLQSIGGDAFCYSYDVEDDGNIDGYQTHVCNITILATTPPTIGTTYTNGIFGKSAQPALVITVPKGCGETYKAADGWSNYADYITEAE